MLNHLTLRELVLHLATQHEKLKDVMEADLRPEVQHVFKTIYPAVVEGDPRVKQERMKSVLEQEDEDVDDPSPAKALVVKTVPAIKNIADMNSKVDAGVNMGPRIDKVLYCLLKLLLLLLLMPILPQVHNCLVCDTKDGRNLSLSQGTQELRYHYAVCFYDQVCHPRLTLLLLSFATSTVPPATSTDISSATSNATSLATPGTSTDTSPATFATSTDTPPATFTATSPATSASAGWVCWCS